MPIVPIAELQEGHVLNQPVYSPRGVLLAPEGTTLQETHLALFTSWGVKAADVSGEIAAQGPRAGPAEDEVLALQELLDVRFAPAAPLSPFMREVRAVAEEILIQRRVTQGKRLAP